MCGLRALARDDHSSHLYGRAILDPIEIAAVENPPPQLAAKERQRMLAQVDPGRVMFADL